MRSRFDEQLSLLNRELIEMGALCEEAIALASRALMEGDQTLPARVSQIDAEIDQMERRIESMCLKLLLQQQPVARDLRQIEAVDRPHTTALGGELRRIRQHGDLRVGLQLAYDVDHRHEQRVVAHV